MKVFGERLRALRKEKGLTQTQLAVVLGVSYGAVHGWETDKQEPSIESLVKLATYFDVSTDYLVGQKEI